MSLSLVKELREKTGAGLLDCQKALGEADGDPDKALRLLREKGLAKAAKKASRVAADGAVGSYIHPGAKIGVLIEVNCETDFVAKTDEFQTLVRDLAMQVAAASPRWVRREDVPDDELESERAIYRVQAEQSGKPAQVIERIVAGQVERYLKDICLLEQAFIKQSDRTVKDVVQETIARLGENVTVRRFARFQLGESQERRADERNPADQEQVDKETPAGGAPGA
jgi:elongation factor Ts